MRAALTEGPLPRRPLTSGGELLVVAVALVVLLGLLFPGQRHFEQLLQNSGATPDDLAIAYVENLLLTDRGNLDLHLLLASAQAERIEYNAIERMLEAVERNGNPMQRRQAMQIRLQALVVAYHAGRNSLPPNEIDVLLHTLATGNRPAADLAYIADSALSLGRTDLALQLYLRLAREAPQHIHDWVNQDTMSSLIAAYRAGQISLPPPEIDELLNALAAQQRPATDLALLADSALALGRTELAWLLYLRLADAAPQEYRGWVEPAALRSLGQGNYRFAADLYFLARRGAARAEARRLFAQGVGALMARSNFAEAMLEAERNLGDLADDAETLRFLVRTARAADDNPRAAEYARRLVTLGADSQKDDVASKGEAGT